MLASDVDNGIAAKALRQLALDRDTTVQALMIAVA
jgi:hypothetical protein